ncbi:SDR family NAD(P)-dependent oxidoreductase [Pleionea sp. CnH1-48]|uniref:SDR family NAD(P)-dependent oxidoreductase n=1 Tax=Pleionea sp. CnH1-48 TaxID=2954494 RepID=UPI0020975168|nr:SDR family NAD(P)-dependent oxidoreductase [Pleionea sp. CnH1-48]MCO7226915.1 SDR family NAD(P)-dependent oxidoreductase [Pleionea sp. CnH1-48]
MMLANKTLFITGVTSGIGEGLLRHACVHGARVYGCGRNEAKLNALASEYSSFVPIVLDISKHEDWRRCFCNQLVDVSFDIAILNAGTCEYLDDAHIDVALVDRLVATNFSGNILGMQMLMDKMTHSGGGTIAVMSSSAAFFPMPRAEAYGASKAALSYFTEAYAVSAKCKGIHFCTINPGFIKTPLTDKNDFPMPMMVSSEQLAKKVFDGLLKKKATINYPVIFTSVLRMIGCLPVNFRQWIAGRMLKT